MPEHSSPPPPPLVTKVSLGRWWFVWIFATVVMPGSTLSLLSGNPANEIVDLAIGPLVLAFVLHVTSSIRLGSGGSGIFTLLLLFGGWLLMAASLFAGCFAVFGPS